MKKPRLADERIIGFSRQAESGVAVKDLRRKYGFSDASFYSSRSGVPVGCSRLQPLDSQNHSGGALPPAPYIRRASNLHLATERFRRATGRGLVSDMRGASQKLYPRVMLNR